MEPFLGPHASCVRRLHHERYRFPLQLPLSIPGTVRILRAKTSSRTISIPAATAVIHSWDRTHPACEGFITNHIDSRYNCRYPFLGPHASCVRRLHHEPYRFPLQLPLSIPGTARILRAKASSRTISIPAATAVIHSWDRTHPACEGFITNHIDSRYNCRYPFLGPHASCVRRLHHEPYRF